MYIGSVPSSLPSVPEAADPDHTRPPTAGLIWVIAETELPCPRGGAPTPDRLTTPSAPAASRDRLGAPLYLRVILTNPAAVSTYSP